MVVASPLNLKRVTTSAGESKKRVTETRDSVKNIGKILFRRTKVKREAFAQTNLFRKRREENERRQQQESELEAPRVVINPTGPQRLIQATAVGGFFDRILGFIGYLSAGWLMNNLPTWIAMGKEFIARIQKAGQILSGFFNNTVKLFVNVGNLLGAVGQNLLQFDFFDTSNRVKDAMSGLNFTMENLTGQIEEAFSLLTTPLTEGKYSGEQIPGVGTQYQDEGAYGEPPPYTGGVNVGGGTKYPELAALVVKGEGGLNSVNRGNAGDTPGGAKSIFGRNLTDMTVGEIMQAQREGRVFAVGKYQFIPVTLEGAVKYTKIPLNAKFNSATQNRLFDYLIDVKRPEIGAYINGKSNNRRIAIQQLAREFASVGLEYPEAGRVRGQSRYAGVGRNRASISPEAAGEALDKQRRGGPAQLNQQPTRSGSQPVVVSSGSAQYVRGNWETGAGFNPAGAKDVYGRPIVLSRSAAEAFAAMMRDSGGKVKGSDVASSQRSPAKNEKVGGAVRSKHLKGLALDIHGTSNSWIRQFGSRYGWRANDYSGSHGGHFEFSGATIASESPAQIAAPMQQTNMIPFSLTPERRGQDVMVVIPQQQQNIITPATGGGDMAPSPISDFELLNNFIKNKLLLDLAYV